MTPDHFDGKTSLSLDSLPPTKRRRLKHRFLAFDWFTEFRNLL